MSLTSMGVGFGKVVQVAYLVEDMDEAMAHWVRQLGVGPWTCIRDIRLAPQELPLHGRRGELRVQE